MFDCPFCVSGAYGHGQRTFGLGRNRGHDLSSQVWLPKLGLAVRRYYNIVVSIEAAYWEFSTGNVTRGECICCKMGFVIMSVGWMVIPYFG